MFNFIILLEVLFSLIKCYDDNDRIKEIQFGNHSIVFEEKIIYYYMNIESMDINNRNEGTIILNGTIKDINQYLLNILLVIIKIISQKKMKKFILEKLFMIQNLIYMKYIIK